jgi:hypothetical protein
MVKLSLCLINKTPRHEEVWGSGDIAPRNLYLCTTWRWTMSFTPRPLYPRVLGSNLGRDTCYSDWSSRDFRKSLWDSAYIWPKQLPSKSFKIHKWSIFVKFDAIPSSCWYRHKNQHRRRCVRCQKTEIFKLISDFVISLLFYMFSSVVCMTVERVWICEWIYWPSIHTTKNYK